MRPILYTFRRCPYAIRARMALAYAGIEVESREVFLKNKPPSMLQASPKGTVPVLVLPGNKVVDESYDVMCWALEQNDPAGWFRPELQAETDALINENDFPFKRNLDRYKYADRYPGQTAEQYREAGEAFLQKLQAQLVGQRFLFGENMTLADVALFPFIRQFAFVDKAWFDQSPYPDLQRWLEAFLESGLFLSVMKKKAFWVESPAPEFVQASPNSSRR
ncbi:MAG TPA: glutathione S-transferase [Xanthomonadales bacterium]|nr:glutathione S-transferase [Xanthomonadales bacterium]